MREGVSEGVSEGGRERSLCLQLIAAFQEIGSEQAPLCFISLKPCLCFLCYREMPTFSASSLLRSLLHQEDSNLGPWYPGRYASSYEALRLQGRQDGARDHEAG